MRLNSMLSMANTMVIPFLLHKKCDAYRLTNAKIEGDGKIISATLIIIMKK